MAGGKRHSPRHHQEGRERTFRVKIEKCVVQSNAARQSAEGGAAHEKEDL